MQSTVSPIPVQMDSKHVQQQKEALPPLPVRMDRKDEQQRKEALSPVPVRMDRKDEQQRKEALSPVPVRMDRKHVQQQKEALNLMTGMAFGPNREGKDAEAQPTATLENGAIDLLSPAPLQTAALRVHRHWASAPSKAAESDESVLDCSEASADCNGSLDVQLPAAATASVQRQSRMGRRAASAISADISSTGMQSHEASYAIIALCELITSQLR